jgi:hypothetical protein
LSNCEF